MRKTPIVTGELYHIFNRGTDKRIIFSDEYDIDRFIQSMQVFNTVEPVGSIFEQQFKETVVSKPLVSIIAYCLLPNHFHLILKQEVDSGISLYMKRLSGGYSLYYNNKQKRSGVLFQGKYKSAHINTNEYLLYLSAYVNLNYKQSLGSPTPKSRDSVVKPRSSFTEFTEEGFDKEQLCLGKSIVLNQFKSKEEYNTFALKALEEIQANKKRYALLNED